MNYYDTNSLGRKVEEKYVYQYPKTKNARVYNIGMENEKCPRIPLKNSGSS